MLQERYTQSISNKKFSVEAVNFKIEQFFSSYFDYVTIIGTDESDYIKVGHPNDNKNYFAYGGDGDDLIESNYGNNILMGGAGNDTYSYTDDPKISYPPKTDYIYDPTGTNKVRFYKLNILKQPKRITMTKLGFGLFMFKYGNRTIIVPGGHAKEIFIQWYDGYIPQKFVWDPVKKTYKEIIVTRPKKGLKAKAVDTIGAKLLSSGGSKPSLFSEVSNNNSMQGIYALNK